MDDGIREGGTGGGSRVTDNRSAHSFGQGKSGLLLICLH